MQIIQDVIEQTLSKLPEQFVSELIKRKLVDQGINLTKREHKLLNEYISQGAKGSIRLGRWKWWDQKQVIIEFTHQELEDAGEEFKGFIENQLPVVLEAVVDELTERILATIRQTWGGDSKQQHLDRERFHKRLRDHWKKPLEGLKLLLTISREMGEALVNKFRKSPDPFRQNLIEVLIRLHVRSCQVTDEIICLLEGGFADGAMARWRTLHEIAVVTLFISQHGEELAERYFLHQAVGSKQAADEFQKSYRWFGYEPLNESEVKLIQNEYDEVVEKFGDYFKEPYGWAANHLPNKKPKFTDIEKAVGVDHFRAYYKMASYNVHANPRGLFFKLGLVDEPQLLLAGASNAGFVEPGSRTAYSLLQISSQLALLSPNFDSAVGLRVMTKIVIEIEESFHHAHENLLEKIAQ